MRADRGDRITFSEIQKMRQLWVWILVISITALAWYGFIVQIILKTSFGGRPAPDIILVVFWIVFGLGLPVFLCAVRLTVEVREDGIYFRFFPFHRTFRRIGFEEIRSCRVRQYHPIREYGGWGIRKGRSGRAYNMSGNLGVELALKNGKNLLLGSLRAEELNRSIRESL